jgi:nucleoside phosphorylase/glycosyltransferase involved in cell wall biosynthesis
MVGRGRGILFLMNGWMSSAGGIQTVNRKLACSIAKQYEQLDVICLVQHANEAEIEDARNHGVRFISGNTEGDWAPALMSEELDGIDSSQIIGVIGHSKYSGREAALLKARRFTHAAHVQFVHTIPYDTESLKEYRQESFVREREERMREELQLASQADVVACIGPRITRSMKDQLNALEWRGKVLRVDCGVERSVSERVSPEQPTVLFIGRTDSRLVKGLDIFALAAGNLHRMWVEDSATRDRPTPRFAVRGGSGNLQELERELTDISAQAGARAVIRVRPYTPSEAELRRDLLQASIVVMPSREEGFGLVACEAVSFRVPVVVSSESGIAEVIRGISTREFFDLGGTIVSMDGSTEEVGQRFADSMRQIFEDEERSANRTHRLGEFLNAECSWDVGARSLAEVLLEASQSPQALDEHPDEAASHVDGAAQAANAQNAERVQQVLSRRREELSRLPGVLAVGAGQNIVVIVRTGHSPDLPDQIEGIDVVVQYVDDLQRFSADKIRPGDVVLVDGALVACVGPILSERGGRSVAVTAAHAFWSTPSGARITVRTSNDSSIPASLHVVDHEEDLALLTSDYIGRGEVLTDIPHPKLGAKVNIVLPGRLISGRISALDVELSSTQENIGGPDVPFFVVDVESPELRPGDSGAMVVYEEDKQPVGVLIASGSSPKSSTVFVRPLHSFLNKYSLQAQNWGAGEGKGAIDQAKIQIAVLLDHMSLEQFLGRLDSVTEEGRSNRLYYKGFIKGRPEMAVSVFPLQYQGNLGAAVSATNMLRDFDPDCVLLVGLAGGVSHDLALGDVVIANSVIHYEPARLSDSSVSPRFKVIYNSPPSFMTLARKASNEPVKLQIELKNYPEKRPRVFIGSIASGEKVFLSHSQFDETFKDWAKVIAVDMEGAGVAEAIVNYSKVVPFAIVRGVADKLDQSKNDLWIDFARDSANAVAINLAEAFAEFKKRTQ